MDGLLRFARRLALWMTAFLLPLASTHAAPPRFADVAPLPAGAALAFPRDFGAHPSYRTEWWYATGWLTLPDGKPLGFQITFFRSATGHDADDPSRFAPTQLIIAHAALSDPALGHLLHDQKIAREGFGLAYAATGDTDVKLDDWRLERDKDGRYRATIPANGFSLTLTLTPTQPPMLQGERGYSQKGPDPGGPNPAQASYYYSQPQLQVSGSVTRQGKTVAVTGTAWLDHEWSTSVLDARAAGWEWAGINLDDGGALMAFRIRDRAGKTLWAHAALRDRQGESTQYGPDQVRFVPQRTWRSPRTGAVYPVAVRIEAGDRAWELVPLQDDQELDSRRSTGSVYWEGAVIVRQDGKDRSNVCGRGYLELTGFLTPLTL